MTSRSELIAMGRGIVTERLRQLGCTVREPDHPGHGKLEVRTPSGRAVEVRVSTQRVGGYAFWEKRRLELAENRLVALVVLGDAKDPHGHAEDQHVFLVPTTEWRTASPPFTDRDNVGTRSDPEYGVSLARSWLGELERFSWERSPAKQQLR